MTSTTRDTDVDEATALLFSQEEERQQGGDPNDTSTADKTSKSGTLMMMTRREVLTAACAFAFILVFGVGVFAPWTSTTTTTGTTSTASNSWKTTSSTPSSSNDKESSSPAPPLASTAGVVFLERQEGRQKTKWLNMDSTLAQWEMWKQDWWLSSSLREASKTVGISVQKEESTIERNAADESRPPREGVRHLSSSSSAHHDAKSKDKGEHAAAVLKNLLYFDDTRAWSLLMGSRSSSSHGKGENGGSGSSTWSDYSSDFFKYQQGWDAQINQAYCGVATSAAVINSMGNLLYELGVELPMDPVYDPHPYATQHDLVLDNECVYERVVHCNDTFDGILTFPGGVTMEQVRKLLECHLPSPTFSVEAHHLDPDEISVGDMHRDLWRALGDPRSRVLISFDRQGLGQAGGGHFSPVGAYSEERDAFLVMDVAKYKYPPVWVPTPVLYRALATVDGCGLWNYPDAQDMVPEQVVRKLRGLAAAAAAAAAAASGESERPSINGTSPSARDSTEQQQQQALMKELFDRLGCKPAYRGYIVVRATT